MPTIVERARIAGWLEFCATTPLRLLIAPAGSGKTTNVVASARSLLNLCAYIKVGRGLPVGALFTQILMAIDGPAVSSYEALLEQLACISRTEMIVDNIDDATNDAREFLGRLYNDLTMFLTKLLLFTSLARPQQ